MRFKSANRWKSSSGKLRYKKWRTSVFKLNKGRVGLSKSYVCEKCNKKRKTTRTLHAHHIYSWKKYPKRRYDIKNGVVLCIYCHHRFHNKYKYDAIEDPNKLNEWIGDNKRISNYIKNK